MNLLLFLPGIILMALVVYDLIYTTFAPRGAGLLTSRITAVVWWFFSTLKKYTNKKQSLSGAGVCIVCATLLNWVLLLWISNILVFSSDPQAVIRANSQIPATFYERIYYTGYILSTMGNGDFRGGTENWSIYSSIISFSGLIMITIGVSYMVPIFSAVTDRRTLSIQIATLGHSPESILLNHWNGKNFKDLEYGLQHLTSTIVRQGQLHLSYPVLHYFHNSDKITALLPNLASLDEALSILMVHLPRETWPSLVVLQQSRRAISSFLDTISKQFKLPSTEDASPLGVDLLRDQDGLMIQEASEETCEQLVVRRRILKAMVENDGWEWKDINQKAMNRDIDAYPGF